MKDDWKQDSRPRCGAWAPGDYLGTCHKCRAKFIGDKRALYCADCAYAEPESAPTPPVTQDAVERVLKECAAELAEFFFPANPPYRSKETMAEDMTLVLARHFRAALAAAGAGKGGE